MWSSCSQESFHERYKPHLSLCKYKSVIMDVALGINAGAITSIYQNRLIHFRKSKESS